MEAVIWGEPAAEALAAEAARLDAHNVFVIASATLNRRTDEVSRIAAALGRRFAGLFDGVRPHVPRGDVVRATLAARDLRADLIVTVGGGSPTDAAKAVALCLANRIDDVAAIDALLPARDIQGRSLPPVIAAPRVPQISIPTTLSAGEFSAIAGVTNEMTGVKDILRHPGLMPRVVILDPAVARHTPEDLFLSTGMRAVDHCVEGVCSAEANPLGDAQALHGLALLAGGMEAVKADPGNLAARLDCLLGAWMSMGPLASGVPMGASHGIGYVLGAKYAIPHGHTSCLMLPAVLEWNAHRTAERQRRISAILGDERASAAVLVDRLIRRLDLPRGLVAAGIAAEDFPAIAEAALATPWVPRNPRPISGVGDLLEILRLAG
ncbi:maleylacetate reductase [Paracoccus aestuarii]|uniref:Maleylacetate reductase n=1 Tax=Paracoccus aestuarii TaxID=453842 RepID=A0A418ZYC8_9RHOB|nr:iron-containing alcohol dehydrogenase [Paracoccus aestuarii]RJL05518.1 maleylacetate reductase [Paracoccus aestuarii]WCQ98615.1 iron-containing alcohol dehydrogenase [Paracoccus aestuarii]